MYQNFKAMWCCVNTVKPLFSGYLTVKKQKPALIIPYFYIKHISIKWLFMINGQFYVSFV